MSRGRSWLPAYCDDRIPLLARRLDPQATMFRGQTYGAVEHTKENTRQHTDIGADAQWHRD
ncbi:MAG TPA: hypothetical protein VGF08_12480, partial [Terriglobales bacterium]